MLLPLQVLPYGAMKKSGGRRLVPKPEPLSFLREG
jgi:hypothetical protein